MSFLIYLSQLPSQAVLIPTLETKELRFTEGHTQGQAVIEGHIWDSNPNLWASVFPSATVLSGKRRGAVNSLLRLNMAGIHFLDFIPLTLGSSTDSYRIGQ